MTAAPSILLALMQSVNQFTFRSKYESLMFGSVQSAARERCLNKLRSEMLAGGLISQNILLIQDDPADARAVCEALTNSSDASFQVEWVRCCSAGLERLATDGKQLTDGIAAVLIDLFLPDSHGIETFDRLFRAAPQIPILVLCASQDEDIAKLAVQHGAQDYLLKARLDSYVLPKALGSMVERSANAEALFV